MDKCMRDDQAEMDHICAYCEARVEDPEVVPGPGDDSAWGELAGEHAPWCEWVETRAHRRPLPE